MAGPLTGVRIVEFSAIGPVPLAAMLLADLGADVVRVDRVAAAQGRPGLEIAMLGMARNRTSIAVDLKSPQGAEVIGRLLDGADVVLEGFRPGVMERLGFGPDEATARNPRLIFGRMTGWGQDGPLAQRSGHDINYAAVAGALEAIGPSDGPPTPPLNYIADFGGGALYLALGVVSALYEREQSGLGQVVDAAMVDGTASMTAMLRGMMTLGMWSDQRGSNSLDGSHPFYRCYETSDGKYVAVGAIEPQFWAELQLRLGLSASDWPQYDRTKWDDQHAQLEVIFRTRTRDDWAHLFADSDACVAPVLSLLEAPQHPANQARGVYVEVDGFMQPAPAPRLSRTPGEVRHGAPMSGEHTDEVLTQLGYTPEELETLRADDVIG